MECFLQLSIYCLDYQQVSYQITLENDDLPIVEVYSSNFKRNISVWLLSLIYSINVLDILLLANFCCHPVVSAANTDFLRSLMAAWHGAGLDAGFGNAAATLLLTKLNVNEVVKRWPAESHGHHQSAGKTIIGRR